MDDDDDDDGGGGDDDGDDAMMVMMMLMMMGRRFPKNYIKKLPIVRPWRLLLVNLSTKY